MEIFLKALASEMLVDGVLDFVYFLSSAPFVRHPSVSPYTNFSINMQYVVLYIYVYIIYISTLCMYIHIIYIYTLYIYIIYIYIYMCVCVFRKTDD